MSRLTENQKRNLSTRNSTFHRYSSPVLPSEDILLNLINLLKNHDLSIQSRKIEKELKDFQLENLSIHQRSLTLTIIKRRFGKTEDFKLYPSSENSQLPSERLRLKVLTAWIVTLFEAFARKPCPEGNSSRRFASVAAASFRSLRFLRIASFATVLSAIICESAIAQYPKKPTRLPFSKNPPFYQHATTPSILRKSTQPSHSAAFERLFGTKIKKMLVMCSFPKTRYQETRRR